MCGALGPGASSSHGREAEMTGMRSWTWQRRLVGLRREDSEVDGVSSQPFRIESFHAEDACHCERLAELQRDPYGCLRSDSAPLIVAVQSTMQWTPWDGPRTSASRSCLKPRIDLRAHARPRFHFFAPVADRAAHAAGP